MIRKAQEKDISSIVPLIMIILQDMELPLVQQFGEKKVSEMMEDACRIEGYRYDYRRAMVMADSDDNVQGVIFGYPHSEEAKIDDAWNIVMNKYGYIEEEPLFSEKETLPGEWYVDTLVVSKAARGHGAGAKLLDAAETLALADGYHTMGLNVDEANPRAQKLYERVGYHVVGDMDISGHHYHHMQKEF